jgi:hypothetical protein
VEWEKWFRKWETKMSEKWSFLQKHQHGLIFEK